MKNLAPWIAVTDIGWFDFLSRLSEPSGRLDEINFWNPSGRPMRRFTPGEPIFLRLKSPRRVIAGYGFFAHFTRLRLDKAWEFFAQKNGAATSLDLVSSISKYRKESIETLRLSLPEIGCTILRDAVLWGPDRWIHWDEREGWASGLVTGKPESNPDRAHRLLHEIAADHGAPPAELVEPFVLRDTDERRIAISRCAVREGQGTFRAMLLDAYGRRCSITGERTEPVLDAAHIQPYLGPASNHVRNGLLLTKEFHTLFDLGYVTVTPRRIVRVSPRLKLDWKNGRRYYVYDGRPLEVVPDRADQCPDPTALEWHQERVFLS